MKKEERNSKKKKIWCKNKNILRDLELKWTKKDKCNKRKESKKESIYKRCLKKTKKTKWDKNKMKSNKDSMI